MPGTRGARIAVTAAVVAAVLVAVATSGAQPRLRSSARAQSGQRSGGLAHLYWSESETSRGPSGSGINNIWRAGLSGSGIDKHLVTGLQIPGAVATGGGRVYWTDEEAGTIGRADLGGSHVNQSFIGQAGDALAVTRQYIYWTISSFPPSPAEIWRARLDGSHPRMLVSLGMGTYIGGLAVDAQHIYWTNRDRGTVGRADVDGTHVQRGFITGLTNPNGLALDNQHLYWASDPSGAPGSIGRADLGGSHVNQHFIPGATEPFGVAVGAGHVYWANFGAGTIGRADIDGTHVRQSFISARVTVAGSDAADPMGLAVGA